MKTEGKETYDKLFQLHWRFHNFLFVLFLFRIRSEGHIYRYLDKSLTTINPINSRRGKIRITREVVQKRSNMTTSLFRVGTTQLEEFIFFVEEKLAIWPFLG